MGRRRSALSHATGGDEIQQLGNGICKSAFRRSQYSPEGAGLSAGELLDRLIDAHADRSTEGKGTHDDPDPEEATRGGIELVDRQFSLFSVQLFHFSLSCCRWRNYSRHPP